ncbi:MAG: hypothetical protein ACD_30C00054G0026 [uncultured bacterium]|nr:MAG: hypothetical protein ACD_30C00054G0026 [uncultured bacterium]
MKKIRYLLQPKLDPKIPDKWTFLRKFAKKQISEKAQLKLEWIIFYHTSSGKNAKATAMHFGISRKTLHKWLSRFDEIHLKSLEEYSRAPRHVRHRQIDLWERGRITKLRKKHLKYGKMKLQRRYLKVYGEYISSWKIQKVIEEGNLYPDKQAAKKAREKKNRHKGQAKKRITQFQKKEITNYLWHVDTVLLTMSSGGYRYLLTAIDEVSKLAYSRLYTTHSSKQAKDFLLRLNYLTDQRIINLHHDNGSEFKKDFEKACEELKLPQWYSRPHTPKDNPVLERFNRTIQEEFTNFWDVNPMDVEDFNLQLLDWLIEYNSIRPHQTLDYQTPLEYIDTHTLEKVSPMYSSSTTA